MGKKAATGWKPQDNFKPGTQYKSTWNHTPSARLRVPEVFIHDLVKLARKWDVEGKQPTLDLESLSLGELLDLQKRLPPLIAQRKEENRDKRFEEALLFLASPKTDVNFSEEHAPFGNWLSRMVASKSSVARFLAYQGWRLLQTYQNSLPVKLPHWEEIDEQFPHSSAVPSIEEVKPEQRLEVWGEYVIVRAPYDPSGNFQRTAKTIPGYEFVREQKCWRFPWHRVEQICQCFPSYDYFYPADIYGLLALYQSCKVQEQKSEEQEKSATEAENYQLLKLSRVNEPLSNGWTLRDYQRQGVEWLLVKRQGAILADDMGLGKTLQALVAAKAMAEHYDCEVLVIAPVSLLENWRRTAETVGINIATYSQHYQKIPQPLDRKYLAIADEAHGFQNENSQRTQAMMRLAEHKNCVGSWYLTGTPLRHGRPINLMPLLMLAKHPVVADKWAYIRRYCNPQQKQLGSRTIWDYNGATNLEELNHFTKDAILRRLKEEVLSELPTKTRLFYPVELTGKAKQEYDTEIRNMVARYKERIRTGEISSGAEALSAINILRSVGSQFKVPAAAEIVSQLIDQGQQAVLFFAYTKPAKELYFQLLKAGISCGILTGDTQPTNRQIIVDRFQEGKTKVFIGTIHAGGVGLTLTNAHHVILVDRDWSYGNNVQAEDRIHRIGQEQSVFATWMQLGTIDPAIDELNLSDAENIDVVLKDTGGNPSLDSPKALAKKLMDIL